MSWLFHFLQVVTVSQKDQVLRDCHLSGEEHLDIKKTQDNVAEKYYWPEMWDDVRKFCQSCEQCQEANRLYCIHGCDHTSSWNHGYVLVNLTIDLAC